MDGRERKVDGYKGRKKSGVGKVRETSEKERSGGEWALWLAGVGG